MTLGDICNFKINMEDADFWLIRKGTSDMVGTPTKKFTSENIGVKVTRTDILYPDFLFYYIQYMHNSGMFKNLAKSTLNLKHLRIEDLSNLPVTFSE